MICLFKDFVSDAFPKIDQQRAGKPQAIHDGQNLEAWFTRGFYKHMLGKKAWETSGDGLRKACWTRWLEIYF